MTTKTIPAYLEGERQKGREAKLRTEEEAARIQPLRHGHHRTAKQPKLELPSAVEAAPKARKTVAASRKTPRTRRKTATKGRKVGETQLAKSGSELRRMGPHGFHPDVMMSKMLRKKVKKQSDHATRASVKKEMARPRMARSARIAELNLDTARIREQPSTTMPGTVDKIIPPRRAS
jgi:hypothetical protein